MAPRIPAEDYVPEGELLEPGLTYRMPLGRGEGHVVSGNGKDTLCGRTFDIPWSWWEEVRRARTEFGRDPGEWYVAYDRRKGDKCTTCKQMLARLGGSVDDVRENLELTVVPVPMPSDAQGRSEWLAWQRTVAWVCRELGATVVAG